MKFLKFKNNWLSLKENLQYKTTIEQNSKGFINVHPFFRAVVGKSWSLIQNGKVLYTG